MIFGRGRRREPPAPPPRLTDDERGVVALLLAGDTPFLATLRRQLDATTPVGRVRRPDAYIARRLMTDADLRRDVATSEHLVVVDDLVIRDDRVGVLAVEVRVLDGTVNEVVFRPAAPVAAWPDEGPRADAYGYRGPDEDPTAALGRTDRDLSRWAAVPPPKPAADVAKAPAWLRPLLDGPPPAEPVTAPPATAAALKAAEAETGFALPAQYKQLVRWSDGVALWGVAIAGLTEAYVVDGRLVFNVAGSGSVSALDADGAVWFGDAGTGEFKPFVGSLKEWVEGCAPRPHAADPT